MRTGEIKQALHLINAWLAKTATSDWHQLKGQSYYLQGNLDLALDAYDEALRKDPDNQDALMNKAIALADGGSLYESLALLDQWIQKNPDDFLLRYNKGTVLSDLWYQQRNVAWTWSFSYYGDALRHFEKSYRLNPNYQNTAIWLWITYLDLSQYRKAHQALDTVLSANPDAYDAWYYKAQTYKAEGNIEEAKKTYTHLLSINPEFDLAKQELLLLEQQSVPNE
jgi:tetratricopeptide (TPR) repeat protein